MLSCRAESEQAQAATVFGGQFVHLELHSQLSKGKIIAQAVLSVSSSYEVIDHSSLGTGE